MDPRDNPSTDPVPHPPTFAGHATGWLEPAVTRAMEVMARAGARQLILEHGMPTEEQANAAVERSEFLAYQPDWEHHLSEVFAGRRDCLAVVLRDEVALDDATDFMFERLRAYWAASGGSSALAQFLDALSTPALITLALLVSIIHGGAEP